MDGGSGGNHAPRAPPEIGGQDNQGSISKNLNGPGRRTQGGAGKWFFKTVACSCLIVEGARCVAPLWSKTWIKNPESSESDASAVPEFYILLSEYSAHHGYGS
jgi:hypothetical protein